MLDIIIIMKTYICISVLQEGVLNEIISSNNNQATGLGSELK